MEKTEVDVQGQIQCSSFHGTDEVVFPSYEIKNVSEVPLYSQTIYIYFPTDFDTLSFPWFSTYVKLLFQSMSFEGDCRSVKVFRIEFLTLKHPIWQHVPKFSSKKLVCQSFWWQ